MGYFEVGNQAQKLFWGQHVKSATTFIFYVSFIFDT